MLCTVLFIISLTGLPSLIEFHSIDNNLYDINIAFTILHYSSLNHPTARILTADWFRNRFIMVVCEICFKV